MSVPVYFLDARSRNERSNSIAKLRALFAQLSERAPDAVREGDLAAIKIHFGETGNDAFISPVLARTASDFAKSKGAKPFFADTNTLYSGTRSNAIDHLNTAISHGFVAEVCGAPVVIADGLRSNDWREVPMPDTCKHFGSTKIAGGILDADSLIVMSHFKGHEMSGFGGAIKNLAMGCAPFRGKRDQHSVRFWVDQEKCVSCARCALVCPAKAASLPSEKGAKAAIDPALCIGCGECMANCPVKAIDMDWEVGLTEFTEKLTEYALGAVAGKKGRVLFVTVIQKVVPLCDCCGWSDLPVVPDQGFLASTDPVAIDQAAFDLVKAAPAWPGSALDGKAGPGDDKFAAMHPKTHGEVQLSHGEAIGLGSRRYELVRL